MKAFANNLRKIMDLKNLTGEKLGEMIGVTKGSVIHWANGSRFPKENHIRDLVKVLNVKYDDLFSSGEELKVEFIPLIGKSSCGIPKDFDLNGYELIPIASNKYKRGMYAVTADGHSMSPKIKHGYTVICDPNQIIDNGKIVHYTLGNGESGIKKYKMNDSGTIISLIPINPDYEVITIHCDDNIDLRMSRVVGSTDNDY